MADPVVARIVARLYGDDPEPLSPSVAQLQEELRLNRIEIEDWRLRHQNLSRKVLRDKEAAEAALHEARNENIQLIEANQHWTKEDFTLRQQVTQQAATIRQMQAALRRAMEALCWAHGRNPDPDYPSVLEQGKAALASISKEKIHGS